MNISSLIVPSPHFCDPMTTNIQILLYVINSHFPCLSGMYFASSMILVSFSCAMTVLVLNIHFRGATGNKLPNWMRRLFLGRLSWLLFVKTGKTNSNKVHSKKNDSEKQVKYIWFVSKYRCLTYLCATFVFHHLFFPL